MWPVANSNSAKSWSILESTLSAPMASRTAKGATRTISPPGRTATMNIGVRYIDKPTREYGLGVSVSRWLSDSALSSRRSYHESFFRAEIDPLVCIDEFLDELKHLLPKRQSTSEEVGKNVAIRSKSNLASTSRLESLSFRHETLGAGCDKSIGDEGRLDPVLANVVVNAAVARFRSRSKSNASWTSYRVCSW